MPKPILSSLILPVKDASTGVVTNVEYDLPASGSSITIDDEISSTSEHPVQNKVIAAALDDKADTSSLGTAATRDVPSTGNANVTQVVIGSDTRLTNARNAADVYDWAKAETKPTYTASEVGTYTTSEIDNMFSTLETNIDWKEAVDTYNDIATTYPNPVDGWTVNVKDTDYTYRYSGSEWVAISANAIPEATTSVNGLMTTTQVTKLNGIATGAEVNQNAFSNVKVGSTTVAADGKTDTLELVAGSNVTLTPDATNDKVTIAATDSTYPNAVKNITRSGTTFTATRYDDTTFTFDQQDNNTVPSAYCTTAAGTAAKVASCTDFVLTDPCRLQILIVNANTKAGALTLNVNSTGAKSIYINNAATSSSNYTLPAGTYQVLYSGSKYYFRTDGKLPGDVAGSAGKVNGLTVETAVPASAVFTDSNVTQGATTTSSYRKILLSGNTYSAAGADVSATTGQAYEAKAVEVQPSTGTLLATALSATTLNGATIGSSPKFTDTVNGYCSTAAGTAAKVVTCSGYVLRDYNRFTLFLVNSNTSASKLTLNVNSTGAKDLYIDGAVSSSSNYTLPAGAYDVYYASSKYYVRTDNKQMGSITGNAENVNGTVAIANGGTGATTRLAAAKALTNENVGTGAEYFVTLTSSWGKFGYTSLANAKTALGLGSAAYTDSTAYAAASHNHTMSNITDLGTVAGLSYGTSTRTYLRNDGTWCAPIAVCNTASATQKKTATLTGFVLDADNAVYTRYFLLVLENANTYAGTITLNINSTGAKNIYIDGSKSSASNMTLPANIYFVYFSGSAYYFRTSNTITGNITGSAGTVNGYTVESNVPSGAVFTDTRDFKLGTTKAGATDNTLYFVYTT